jgi:polysaccharide biosynthesis transport protein
MNLGLYTYEIRRWVLFAIIPALLVGALAYIRTAHDPKTYQATATLYVAAQDASTSGVSGNTDITASQQLVPTYSQLASLPVVQDEVNRSLAAQYPGYSVHGLSVGSSGSAGTGTQTQLINLSVSDTNPVRATDAANAVGKAVIHEVGAIQRVRFKGGDQGLNGQIAVAQSNIRDAETRLATYKGTPDGIATIRAQLDAYQSIFQSLVTSKQEFDVTKNTALNGVRLISPAQTPTTPTGPHPSRTALLYSFIALLVCGGGVFVYDYFDDSPRTPEEIEEIAGAPILGTVQEFSPGKDGSHLVASRARSPMAEAYRIIRTNLQFTDVDNPPHVVIVTSPSPSEGKSTTAANLARVFADAGRRVTLVDADLRRPSLHRIFDLSRAEGLTNILVGNELLNGHDSQDTGQPNLALIASGPIPPRPADLLGSGRMQSYVTHMRDRSDFVIIDSPPVLAVTDAAVLSTMADGVILVVDTAKSKRREILRAREAIEVVGGRVLGVVVNKLSKRHSGYYYYYYHHNYGYQYKYDYSSKAGQPADRETVGSIPSSTEQTSK